MKYFLFIIIILIILLLSPLHIKVESKIYDKNIKVRLRIIYLYGLIRLKIKLYPRDKPKKQKKKKPKKEKKIKKRKEGKKKSLKKKISKKLIIESIRFIRNIKIEELYSDITYKSSNPKISSYVYLLINIIYGQIITFVEPKKIYLRVNQPYDKLYSKLKFKIHIKITIKDIISLVKILIIYIKQE